MTSKKTKRMTICLSVEEWEALKLLGELKGITASGFVRYLLEIHLNLNEPIVGTLKAYKEAKAQAAIIATPS
jgi:hypothetical protein